MDLQKLISDFEGIIGWPYKSPGTNDQNGIDCSGAFVYAYKKQGQSIYHGSNRIIREYCNNVKAVKSAADLKVGMAIFKGRSELSNMKAEYKPGGKYYKADLPLDYYHMGLVTSVAPLRIVNATSPVAKVDTSLSGWGYAGYLNAVDYSENTDNTGTDDCTQLKAIIAQLEALIARYQN